MIRQWLVVISLVAAALLSGCAEPQVKTVVDPKLKQENVSLKNRLDAVESEKTGLADKLRASEMEGRTARLDADKWKKLYDEAKASIPRSGGGLPPELLKRFIEIAKAGGPFELGRAGSLKASSDILFDSGKVTLKATGQTALKDIAPKLKDILSDKRVMLRVDGHTDDERIKFSPWRDNLHLSLMRARAVVDFLAKEGVPVNAMFAAGFGEWHPVGPNTTKEGRAQNRRVELSLVAVAPLAAELEE